jgi:hypothetical protein
MFGGMYEWTTLNPEISAPPGEYKWALRGYTAASVHLRAVRYFSLDLARGERQHDWGFRCAKSVDVKKE